MSTIATSADTEDRQKTRNEQIRKFLEIVDLHDLAHPFAEYVKRVPQPKPRNGNSTRNNGQARSVAAGRADTDTQRRLDAAEARMTRLTAELLQLHAELGRAELQARIRSRVHRAVTEAMQAHTAPHRRVFSWHRDAPGYAPPHWR